MDTLSRHYHQLVGLNSDWAISHVQLDVQNRTLTLSLEFVGTRVVCPECWAACAMSDHAAERSWRHLDALQFQTTLTPRIPRCSCNRCGVKTISVPWAEKHSRFTLLFEAFAIDVLQAAGSIQAAAFFPGIDWSTAQVIMKRAVMIDSRACDRPPVQSRKSERGEE
jgi:transposase